MRAGLALLAVEVGFGELVDGFVGERAAAERHLADGQVEDVVGFLVLEQFLEGVLDDALGQDFGRVVGGGFLAVAPGEAVDECAFLVFLERAVGVEDFFVLLVFRQVFAAYEEGGFELVVFLVGRLTS